MKISLLVKYLDFRKAENKRCYNLNKLEMSLAVHGPSSQPPQNNESSIEVDPGQDLRIRQRQGFYNVLGIWVGTYPMDIFTEESPCLRLTLLWERKWLLMSTAEMFNMVIWVRRARQQCSANGCILGFLFQNWFYLKKNLLWGNSLFFLGELESLCLKVG